MKAFYLRCGVRKGTGVQKWIPPEGGNRSPVKPRIYPSLFLLPGTSARNPGVACQEFHPGKAVRMDNLQKIKGNVPIKPLDFFISTTIFS